MAELAASAVAFRSHLDPCFVILHVLMASPLPLCAGAMPAYDTSFSGLPNLSISTTPAMTVSAVTWFFCIRRTAGESLPHTTREVIRIRIGPSMPIILPICAPKHALSYDYAKDRASICLCANYESYLRHERQAGLDNTKGFKRCRGTLSFAADGTTPSELAPDGVHPCYRITKMPHPRYDEIRTFRPQSQRYS